MFISGGTTKPMFRWTADTGRLYINTPTLKVVFEAGKFIYAHDRVRNVVLLDTTADANMPAAPAGFVGFYQATSTADTHYPALPITANATFSSSGRIGTLTYDPAYNPYADLSGSKIEYQFEVDAEGDILLTITATAAPVWTDLGRSLLSVDVPIMNYAGTSVIAKSEEILHTDADKTLNYVGSYTGSTNAPPVVIAKATGSCLAAWSENNKLILDYINVLHTQNSHTHIVLHASPDPKQVAVDPTVVVSGPWRFTVQATWLDVAKRWRVWQAELNVDLKPLWEKTPAWIRDIHCRYEWHHGTNYADPTLGLPAVVNQGIAAANMIIDPYILGFGDSMVLYGQITPRLTNAYPTTGEQAQLASLSLRSLGYFYYNVVAADAEGMLADAARAAYVPEGYTVDDFNPDYAGEKTNAAWLAYWDAVLYKGGATYKDVIHPGSTQFQTTQLQIFRDWCALWGLSGCFWDTSFTDRDGIFVSEGKSIINGLDFMGGCKLAAKTIYDEGQLVIMPEIFNHHLMAYYPYVWEGMPSYITYEVTTNHPLRAALIGSYVWSQDIKLWDIINADDYNHEAFGYLACLPGFLLPTDYHAPTFGNEYYTARAKLFCDLELFNDLPDTWTDGVLAYYRSNTTNMVRLEKRDTGRYAYVEEDTPEVTRLQHELVTGATCPDTGLAVTYSDTYGTAPTLTAEILTPTAGDHYHITDEVLTGATITCHNAAHEAVERTINWLVFGN